MGGGEEGTCNDHSYKHILRNRNCSEKTASYSASVAFLLGIGKKKDLLFCILYFLLHTFASSWGCDLGGHQPVLARWLPPCL